MRSKNYPGGGRGAFPATSGRHLRIVSQVRSRLLSTGMSSEVSAATQIQSPLALSTWAARIMPIWRLFPSALNVSPTATFGGGVNSSHGRVVPAFIWRAIYLSIDSHNGLNMDVLRRRRTGGRRKQSSYPNVGNRFIASFRAIIVVLTCTSAQAEGSAEGSRCSCVV